MLRIKWLLLLILVSPCFSLFATEALDLEVNVDGGPVINISHYPALSSKLIVWLPSERGISSHSLEVADRLADLNINVWVADLHGSYMVPANRYSIDEFPANDVLQLLIHAGRLGYDEVYFLSAGRGAKLVLDSILQFSSNYPSSTLIKGSILIHPNIYRALPGMGEEASFIASSSNSHLPIYMIQTQYSTKYMFTSGMRHQLEKGGSQVFTHLLDDVEAGFFARPPDDLSPSAIEAKKQLPRAIDLASRLLAQIKPGKLMITHQPGNFLSSEIPVRESTLGKYKSDNRFLALQLPDLNGRKVNLKAYRGRVVLVNFWASWCKPCVKEIPSLTRLGKHFANKPFDILTVNIGESAERVKRFLNPNDKYFEVLLDEDGKAVRDWRVYAFPSNFLIDQTGEIQYAYRGALEWDSPEVVKIIESLL